MKRLLPSLVLVMTIALLRTTLPNVSVDTAPDAVRADTLPVQDVAKQKPKKPKDKEPVLNKFMRKKLDASNNILEGLVTDDLDMVELGADQLLRMSKAELWRASNDPTYARFSKEFQQVVGRLKEKTQKGPVDSSALAWMEVTLSCIHCHEWVRNMIVVEKNQTGANELPSTKELLAHIRSN